MHIYWHGLACFRLVLRDLSILIDPYDASVGLKPPRFASDLVLATSDRPEHGNITAGGGDPFRITGPGEYEVKNVFVWGHGVQHNGDKKRRTTLYVIEAEGLTIAHLGDLSTVLTENQLDRLEGVDILCLPVGGNDVLDAKKASALVSEIEPRIIIPMMYKTPGVKMKLDPVDAFLKEYGAQDAEKVDKLKITPKELPQDATRVVIVQS
ncbi:MAG: MBL fold metallo-hydrolase [Candidatus Nomurabacteria bacterium]|nr:MAG: MBL fold metallo-hydrolase [Candidatus Nomurabacteria bacterium]